MSSSRRLPAAQPGRWLFSSKVDFSSWDAPVHSLQQWAEQQTLAFWIAASDALVATLDPVFPDHCFSGSTQVEQDSRLQFSSPSVWGHLTNWAFFLSLLFINMFPVWRRTKPRWCQTVKVLFHLELGQLDSHDVKDASSVGREVRDYENKSSCPKFYSLLDNPTDNLMMLM